MEPRHCCDMSISDFGKVTQSLQVSNLEVMGHGSSSTTGSIHCSGIVSGTIVRYTTVQSVPTIGNATGVLGGIYTHVLDQFQSFALPSSLSLMNRIPKAKVGTTIPITIVNTGNNSVVLTAPGANSVVGSATISTLTSGSFLIRFTAVGASPTYIAYRV